MRQAKCSTAGMAIGGADTLVAAVETDMPLQLGRQTTMKHASGGHSHTLFLYERTVPRLELVTVHKISLQWLTEDSSRRQFAIAPLVSRSF